MRMEIHAHTSTCDRKTLTISFNIERKRDGASPRSASCACVRHDPRSAGIIWHVNENTFKFDLLFYIGLMEYTSPRSSIIVIYSCNILFIAMMNHNRRSRQNSCTALRFRCAEREYVAAVQRGLRKTKQNKQ